MKAQEVKLLMNECGNAKTPFLFAVDFELQNGIFIKYPMSQKEILFRTPIGSNAMKILSPGLLASEMSFSPISYDDYRKSFDIIMQGLLRGDSYLTNLTIKTPIDIKVSLEDIFLFSNSSYGLYISEHFVCFSPERFVKIANGIISTNPMKGTISANIPNAEDIILSDRKEMAEHCTIVDLLRNDLGMVAEDITVDRFRYIDRINTSKGGILQISSEITGKLSDYYLSHLGDIIFRMLPAGSVSGAPKESTANIIHKAETELRGYYTGVFGYFDGQELDSAVLIRYIEQSNDKFYFRSGGGITVNSIPESEYNETLEKIYFPFL